MNTEELLAALPSLDDTLGTLRDFQRRTVDYVFDRMYTDPTPTTRFLVADEVGLGKTKVAQGIIARALRHLHDKIERIDVIYVCSNAAIARQNLNRLNPLRKLDFSFATRLTLLPLQLHSLRRNRVNLVSFTPGTAIDTAGGGLWRERLLLYWMLQRGLEDVVGHTGTPLRNVLQATVREGRWDQLVREYEMREVDGAAERGGEGGEVYDRELARAFCEAVRKDTKLTGRLTDVLDRFKRLRDHPPYEDNRLRYDVIGELRSALARVCVDALEPDLVILDEFQRFQELLSGDSDAAEIARALFDYKDPKGNLARVLLLSATPYRMLTLPGESEDEDHYRGFLQTFRFLAREDPIELAKLEAELDEHRRALAANGAPGLDPERTAGAVRSRLLRYMCRTERVALTRRQDAMVTEVTLAAPLTPQAVRAGVAIDRIASALGVGNPVEYWKSAPYALSFMRDYELKRSLREASERPSEALLKALDTEVPVSLRREDVRRWRPTDLDHGRVHALARETLDRGLWRLLWLPPSLPYLEPSGPYVDVGIATKALVFSSWNVVPDALAGLLSYEAERRMFDSDATPGLHPYDATDARRRPLLMFRIDREGDTARAGSMMSLALLYPAVTLASLIDPLDIACEGGEGRPISLERAREIARERLAPLVAREVARFGEATAQLDQRWYWALPALLDLSRARLLKWLEDGDGMPEAAGDPGDPEQHRWCLPELFDDDEDEENASRDEGFRRHVSELRDLVMKAKNPGTGDARLLGRPPEDLVDTLIDLALASPAVCALRALRRVARGQLEPDSWSLLAGAAEIARGFRTLFNVPETMALLRATDGDDDDPRMPYWRRVLNYCRDGNLQSVLDELVHMKVDDTGTRDKRPEQRTLEIADVIGVALSPRTSNVTADDVRARPRAGRVDIESFRLRCRFAMRYGEIKDENDSSTGRAEVVKEAFNSPFRPFVLATTSIGQEGLDFHHYCHAVYHWNLPSNPVDLEQREGRVHRYKGHAVRRNIALRLGLSALRDHWKDRDEDPWDCLFRLARERRDPGQTDLVPYWIYEVEGGVSVERRVPMLPLSWEHADLSRLKRDLATYRLVFGQPRQEDLLALLQRRHVDRQPASLERWRIDLTPPAAPAKADAEASPAPGKQASSASRPVHASSPTTTPSPGTDP